MQEKKSAISQLQWKDCVKGSHLAMLLSDWDAQTQGRWKSQNRSKLALKFVSCIFYTCECIHNKRIHNEKNYFLYKKIYKSLLASSNLLQFGDPPWKLCMCTFNSIQRFPLLHWLENRLFPSKYRTKLPLPATAESRQVPPLDNSDLS